MLSTVSNSGHGNIIIPAADIGRLHTFLLSYSTDVKSLSPGYTYIAYSYIMPPHILLSLCVGRHWKFSIMSWTCIRIPVLPFYLVPYRPPGSHLRHSKTIPQNKSAIRYNIINIMVIASDSYHLACVVRSLPSGLCHIATYRYHSIQRRIEAYCEFLREDQTNRSL